MIALPVTGAISASSVGWPLMFYLYGGLGLAWTIAWIFLGADSPSKHSRMSQEERTYVEDGASTEEKEVNNILINYAAIFSFTFSHVHSFE